MFAAIMSVAPSVYGVSGRLDVEIRLDEPVWSIKVRRIGSSSPAPAGLTFVNSYADAERLAKRLFGLKAYDSSGKAVQMTRLGEGVYAASDEFSGFEYKVDASLPEPVIAAPHVTWAASDIALIKLYDLLPELREESADVRFKLPEGWSIYSNEKQTAKMVFETGNYQDAVFVAGTGIRTEKHKIGDAEVSFAIGGKWQFEDSLISAMTSEIIAEYEKIFGSIPDRQFQVNLLPFPVDIGNDRWRAQTQGGTITIISSRSTYRNLASQRLHEQMRHELFHFWIPEGLKLKGDYAWFYEGFARYQSLKTGVWVGRIGFEDFLRSMSEAINISLSDRSGMPLNELSRSIWLTGPGVVSAKGMSLAFYCDILLLARSGGKRSTADILKKLYNKYRGDNAADASESVEAEMNQFVELRRVVDLHVKGTEPIDWSKSLLPFGITAEQRNGWIVLSVAASPKGKAKALLNKLGYNRWKKYSPNS